MICQGQGQRGHLGQLWGVRQETELKSVKMGEDHSQGRRPEGEHGAAVGHRTRGGTGLGFL